METRCRICLHYIISEIGAGPIRAVIRVLRAIVGRYTTTRRPSSRTRCTGRVYTVNISMNLRCARWSLMAPQTDLRRGMRFRSVLSLSPSWGDTMGSSTRTQGIARFHVGSSSRNRMFCAWTTVSRLSVNKHFIRRSDVENSNWSRETRVRFNLDGFRRYQRYFKCKLIDLSALPASLPPSRQSRVSDMNLPHRYFSQRKQKHGKLYALIRL